MNCVITVRGTVPPNSLIMQAVLITAVLFLVFTDPDTEYLIGMSFEKAGNRVAAINIFRRVVHSHPNHAPAHAALGAAYREAGNYAEARLELERAVELDSDDLRANYQLGLVYAKLGDGEAAKKMFARADDLRSRNRNQERVILKLIEAPQP